jgi:hypothetical protein
MGPAMALVMIKCPHTARPVFTGIEVDEGGFNSLPEAAATTTCVACGMTHQWRRAEAWLADYNGQPLTPPPEFLRRPLPTVQADKG